MSLLRSRELASKLLPLCGLPGGEFGAGKGLGPLCSSGGGKDKEVIPPRWGASSAPSPRQPLLAGRRNQSALEMTAAANEGHGSPVSERQP